MLLIYKGDIILRLNDERVGLGYTINNEKVKVEKWKSCDDFQVSEIHLNGNTAKFWTEFVGGCGELTFGVLEKIGISTINAILKIAELIGIDMELIGYGGLKDAFAHSWQFITIPGKVHKLFYSNIKFFPIEQRSSPFSSQESWGNHFWISLYTQEKQYLKDLFNKVVKEPIPAYYGLQRFGEESVDTHLIGLYILKKEYTNATKKILEGKWGWYEKVLAECLKDHDEKNCLKLLPHKLVKLFINAYQSYIFNKALSKFICEKYDLFDIRVSFVGVVDKFGLPTKVIPFFNEKHMRTMVQNRKAYLLARLAGSEIGKYDDEFSTYELELLETDGLKPEDFIDTPCGKIKGSFRPIHFWVECPKLEEYDEKIMISFKLIRGMYATVFLREFVEFM